MSSEHLKAQSFNWRSPRRMEMAPRVPLKQMETSPTIVPSSDQPVDLLMVEDEIPVALRATDELLQQLAKLPCSEPPAGLCQRTVDRCQASAAAPGKSPVW